MNVVLQSMLHNPILNRYFLANGHQTFDCPTGFPDCIGCAVSEAFSDFNNTDKLDGFGALNLLLASWRASTVSISFLGGPMTQLTYSYAPPESCRVSTTRRPRILPIPCRQATRQYRRPPGRPQQELQLFLPQSLLRQVAQ